MGPRYFLLGPLAGAGEGSELTGKSRRNVEMQSLKEV